VWEELGFRYYYEGALFDGGQRLLNLSDSSFERALLLDPNLISSAAFLIVNRTERGEIANASAHAVALVRRRPQSAEAHFLLAYILRYAGLLEDAAHECQTAVSLDRHNFEFRSCAWTYMQLNRPQMAMQFVRLDEASEWSARATAYILLGQGKLVEALQTIQRISLNRQRMYVDLFEACFDTSKRSALDVLSLQAESTALADSDPEDRYILGSLLLRCGEKDAALRLIRSALEHNYCAYTALQTDPLLEELRRGEVYNALLAIANDCQSKFVNRLKHSSP
jgi:tetratricopeptide (TPR) repeat protein